MIGKLKKALKAKMKGIGGLDDMILAFVVMAIVVAIGLVVLSNVQGTLTAASLEYNATGDLIQVIVDNIPLIGTVLVVAVAAVIITLVRGGLARQV